MLAHPVRLRLAVFGLLGLTCVLIYIGLTDMGWCVPALHAALAFITALATWWLARDDLAVKGTGAVVRLLLTGASVGLGLTWAAAVIVALQDVGAGAAWTNAESGQVLRHFLTDTALHWTPLGLMSALIGTGLALIIDEVSGTSTRGGQQH